jgi:hypothetical protein
MQWEYHILHCRLVAGLASSELQIELKGGKRYRGLDEITLYISWLGQQGWELVAVMPSNTLPGTDMFFKRQMTSQPTEK